MSRFCTNCGNPIKDTTTFCTECGSKVEKKESAKIELGSSIGQRTELENTPVKMTKRKKWLLIAGIVFVLLLIGLYKTAEYFTDKDRLIDRFESALVEQDKEQIVDLLSTENKTLKITKDSLEGLFAYLEENPDVESRIIQSLKSQSLSYTETGQSDYDSEESFLYLKKEEKKFFLFDKYSINIAPVYVEFHTNYKDTTVLLNEIEIGKTKSSNAIETYGPFLPGLYTIEAKLANDFVDLKENRQITLLDTVDKNMVELYLNGKDVEVYLENSENFPVTSKLFIDGVETDVDILKDSIFGPVTTDGSMKMQVEIAYPWGKMKTKEQKINDSYIEITNNPFTEEQITNIANTINQYNKEDLNYLATNKKDSYTTVTEEYLNNLDEILEDYIDNQSYFKGKYLRTSLYTDSIDLYYVDETWQLYVTVTNTYKGTTSLNGEAEEFESDSSLQLNYDEKNNVWLVASSSYGDSSMYLDSKVHEVENEKAEEIEIGKESEVADFNNQMEENIDYLMDDYLYYLIDAINYNNFSSVSPYLKENSNLYESQKKLVANLYEQDITEELEEYEITSWEYSGNVYTIKTKEKITIYYADGDSETKDYNWTYTAEYNPDDDELLLTDLK